MVQNVNEDENKAKLHEGVKRDFYQEFFSRMKQEDRTQRITTFHRLKSTTGIEKC